MSDPKAMDHDQPPKKIRKGAKSCTECRRRKIRCVWLSEDAHVCRRCEERGTECVPQVFSSQTAKAEGSSSRERITRLEQQVGSLIAVVNAIQQKHGGPLVSDTFSDTAALDQALSSDDSDELDEPESHPPSYLARLFNNDVISPGEQSRERQSSKEPFSTVLARKARDNLQKLVPPEDDVKIIAGCSAMWLNLYQTLFPTTAVAQTEEDVIGLYGAMRHADVDPTLLATWLVTIAITAPQIPAEKAASLRGIKDATQYARAVSTAVEAEIVAHDSLMSTMSGLECALHFVRLQATYAGFKKIWLTLRRIIAIAELIGLPRTVPAVSNGPELRLLRDKMANQDRDTIINSRVSKAETWISICVLDRIIGMMCNLPTGTSRYSIPSVQLELVDLKDFPQTYLRCLAGIGSRLLEIDDLRMTRGSNDEVYSEVLKTDRDLISLASAAPKDWWDNDKVIDWPLQLLPYWHYYITLRTHLLLTLVRDDNHRFDYSRFTCMYACQQALLRFLKMRRILANGFFLGRMMDLQALTAAIVLLLSYHATKSDPGFQFPNQTVNEPSALVMQVVAVMEETMQQKSSDFARLAAPTLRSLKSLLEDDGRFHAKDLTLKVPLLGKIHVKRKDVTTRSRTGSAQAKSSPASESVSYFSSLSGFSTSPTTTNIMASSDVSQKAAAATGWNFDPFTWFIEDDHDSVFRDVLLADDLSNFDSPLSYNFQFAN